MMKSWRDGVMIGLIVLQAATLILIVDFRYRVHHIGEEIGAAFGNTARQAFSPEAKADTKPSVAAAVQPTPKIGFAMPDLEIVSIDTKVTESNDQWSRFAYILVVKNNTSTTRTFKARVIWTDDAGFPVDERATGQQSLDPGETASYSGHDLITASAAVSVKKVRAVFE